MKVLSAHIVDKGQSENPLIVYEVQDSIGDNIFYYVTDGVSPLKWIQKQEACLLCPALWNTSLSKELREQKQ